MMASNYLATSISELFHGQSCCLTRIYKCSDLHLWRRSVSDLPVHWIFVIIAALCYFAVRLIKGMPSSAENFHGTLLFVEKQFEPVIATCTLSQDTDANVAGMSLCANLEGNGLGYVWLVHTRSSTVKCLIICNGQSFTFCMTGLVSLSSSCRHFQDITAGMYFKYFKYFSRQYRNVRDGYCRYARV